MYIYILHVYTHAYVQCGYIRQLGSDTQFAHNKCKNVLPLHPMMGLTPLGSNTLGPEGDLGSCL